MTVPKKKEDRVRRFALALLGVSMGVAVVTTIVGGIDDPYDIVTLVVCGSCASLVIATLIRER